MTENIYIVKSGNYSNSDYLSWQWQFRTLRARFRHDIILYTDTQHDNFQEVGYSYICRNTFLFINIDIELKIN